MLYQLWKLCNVERVLWMATLDDEAAMAYLKVAERYSLLTCT